MGVALSGAPSTDPLAAACGSSHSLDATQLFEQRDTWAGIRSPSKTSPERLIRMAIIGISSMGPVSRLALLQPYKPWITLPKLYKTLVQSGYNLCIIPKVTLWFLTEQAIVSQSKSNLTR